MAAGQLQVLLVLTFSQLLIRVLLLARGPGMLFWGRWLLQVWPLLPHGEHYFGGGYHIVQSEQLGYQAVSLPRAQ